MIRASVLVVLLAAPLPLSAGGGELIPPIVENRFERVTRHDELQAFVKHLGEVAPVARPESIGTTTQGREIPMVVLSRDGAAAEKLRVLVFCQQHGNEPSGKEATLMLLAMAGRGELDALLARMDLLVIPSVNPDGNEAGVRHNATGADLNRDHLLLAQPETRAVHAVFNRWLPEVTLDVHEYSPWGRSWQEAGYVRAMDEQFGAPTHPNVARSLVRMGVEQMFPRLEEELRAEGFRFFNYIIVGSPRDTLRHSTTNINDGRQSLAIQNTFSFILEGRNGRTLSDILERRSKGQLAAILAFLRFAADNADSLRTLVAQERAALPSSRAKVALVNDHPFEGVMLDVPVRTVPGDRDSVVRMPHRPVVKPLLLAERPLAYVVPRPRHEITDVLRRHGIQMEVLAAPRKLTVEVQTPYRWNVRILEEDSIWTPDVTVQREERIFAEGDVIVRLAQRHAHMIPLALEPASMYGLVQKTEFGLLGMTGKEYPVYRVVGE